MTATYSSYDTLTIGQYDGLSGLQNGRLPVLAEIPSVGRPARDLSEKVYRPADAAHTAPPPPSYEPTPRLQAQPAPPVETVQAMSPPDASEWDEGHWAARLLELESMLRPHARFIALVALIMLTGVTLALLRAPISLPQQAPPTDIVDAPEATPAISAHANASQLVAVEPEASLQGVTGQLEPIPPLPKTPTLPQARITAVGPAGAPPDTWAQPADDITPLESTAPTTGLATSAGPAQPSADPMRVAERMQYPTTGAPSKAWRPQPENHSPQRQPPVARLLSPSNP